MFFFAVWSDSDAAWARAELQSRAAPSVLEHRVAVFAVAKSECTSQPQVYWINTIL